MRPISPSPPVSSPASGDREHDAETNAEAEHDGEELEVVRFEEHQPGRNARRNRHGADGRDAHDQHRRAQRAEPVRDPRQQPADERRAGRHGDEQQQELAPLAAGRLHRDLEQRDRGENRNGKSGESPHGSNRYPTPHTVCSHRGSSGLTSSLRRSRRT